MSILEIALTVAALALIYVIYRYTQHESAGTVCQCGQAKPAGDTECAECWQRNQW